MFKKAILILTFALALSMGACGKKDDANSGNQKNPVNDPAGNGGNLGNRGPRDGDNAGGMKLVGACNVNNGVQLCAQLSTNNAVPTDQFNQAVETFRADCARQDGAQYSTQACSTANVLAGCRSKPGAPAQQLTFIYKAQGFEFPVDQYKSQCERSGMEFYRP